MPPPLVVFADDWGRHPSSCQHLIRRLIGSYRILWVNTVGTRKVKADALTLRRGLEKLRNWKRGLKAVAPDMWVLDVPMVPEMGHRGLRRLNQHLVAFQLRRTLLRLGMRRPIFLTTLPYVYWFVASLPRSGLIYYCTDDYSHWPGADRETLQEAEQTIIRHADRILAASQALTSKFQATGRSQYFPHGVDFSHFATAATRTDFPAAIDRLPRPRIGFFGLIYEKLNFPLLDTVARRFPDGSLAMIGPQVYCDPEFARNSNVHFLGPQPYEQLPALLAGLDVLLLPYVDDAMIRQSGPLKLRECLATGKPTVSIDVPEVRRLQPHVRIGHDIPEFLSQIEAALAENGDRELRRRRQEAVMRDSWDERAAELQRCLRELATPLSAGLAAPRLRRTRVLHLRTITGKGGGPEKTLLNSPRFLQDAFDLRLLYLRPAHDPEFDMDHRARELGVDLVAVGERSALDPVALARVVWETIRFRPDLLHPHDYKTNILSIPLGRLLRIPVVTTLHGYGIPRGRLELYYQLDGWALRRMHALIAVSEDLEKHVAALGIPRSRIHRIENAIDTEQYSRRQTRDQAKQALGLEPRQVVVGAVGRLAPEKGFDGLIRAAAPLLQQTPDMRLLIAGDGPERRALESLIAELNLQAQIRLLGHCSNLLPIYEAMDIFVLSSLREGLPNVLLEAMALETPVLATRVAGVPNVIEDGVSGLLVEPGNPQALRQALGRLLADGDLRDRLARNARAVTEGRFSFARRMARIRAVYNRVLGRQPSLPDDCHLFGDRAALAVPVASRSGPGATPVLKA